MKKDKAVITRIDSQQYEQLMKICDDQERSISYVIRKLIKEFVKENM